MLRKSICFISIIFTLSFAVFGQSQGEKLFKENKPKEAVQVLENEILNGQISANTYNFLGLGYYQLEEYAKSIDAFNRGIAVQPSNLKLLSFNQGNTYYAMKDYSSAISCYSTSLKDDPEFYDALLNRANAFLMADQLGNAKTDYETFIQKCPEDKQKPKIEKLIQAIADEIARREEEERLLAEQNKALWEQFDPTIDEDNLEKGALWEKVDASIEENQNEDKKDWQQVDAGIEENRTENKKDWQKVDAAIGENKSEKKVTPWEKLDGNEAEVGKYAGNSESERLNDEFSSKISDSEKADWEKLDSEHMEKLSSYDQVSAEVSENEWENLSAEEALEMKRLEKESKAEHDKWLEEQSLLRQKAAEEELKKLQQTDEAERQARENLLEEMMKAEESRRSKLLNDVANSLQNNDSTNMSSGADDIIEYDEEGELD